MLTQASQAVIALTVSWQCCRDIPAVGFVALRPHSIKSSGQPTKASQTLSGRSQRHAVSRLGDNFVDDLMSDRHYSLALLTVASTVPTRTAP